MSWLRYATNAEALRMRCPSSDYFAELKLEVRITTWAYLGSVHGGGVISVWIDGVFFCRFLSGLGWSPRQAV